MLIGKYLPTGPTYERPNGAQLGTVSGAIGPGHTDALVATTLGLSAKQAAAFLLLRLPRGGISDPNQFKEGFVDREPFSPDKPDGYAANGMPVYGRIILGDPNKKEGEANTYTDAQGVKGSYLTVELDCAVVSVDFNSKVVKTDIQGLGYSIKEWIASGDNDVTIEGIYNSTPGVAPLDFIYNMKNLFTAPVPIPVTNYYLNLLDISYIVIMPGTSMGQAQGGYATQTFTIKAVSDVPMTEMLP